jgi:hypothetical protein
MKRLLVAVSLAALPLAACAGDPGVASPRGTVTGRFMLEGGPISLAGRQPSNRPIPGTVQFTDGRHRPLLAHVGRSGNFSVSLPPGRYTATSRSPRVIEVSNSTNHETTCSQPLSVTVRPHHTTTITLTCIVP